MIAPQVRLTGTVSVRLTTPANPLIAVTVMVEFAALPAMTGAGGAIVIVKSRNWNDAVTECTREPLVPVTVRV